MTRFVWLLVALTALAGCSDAPLETQEGTPGEEADQETQHNATADATELVASFTGMNLTGPAPLLATFSINATDNATWLLDFGDSNSTEGTSNGTPELVTYSYVTVGTFNATLNVTSGMNWTIQNLTVVVTEGATEEVVTPPGAFVTEKTEAYSGTILVGTQGAEGCALAGSVDKATHTFTVPADMNGLSVGASKFVVHMDLGSTNLDSDVYLYAPGGKLLGSGTNFNAIPILGSGSPTEDFTVEGNYGAGDYTIEVLGCTAVAADYDVSVTATIVTA